MACLGTGQRLHHMMGRPLPLAVRLRWFLNLNDHNHLITSPATDNYNCIAWAYGVSNRWMWPGSPDYYWPSDTTGSDELQTLVQLYLNAGYEPCASGDLEDGFEKVAIYVDQQGPTHAALQIGSGRWTSKLGGLEDIEHDTVEAIESDSYGEATVFLKRRRT